MTNLTQRLEAQAAQMESKGYKELSDLLREAVKEIKMDLYAAQDMCVDMEQAKRERDKAVSEIERVKQVLYCLDGWYQDLVQENFGDAKGWLRHLEKAYSDYFNEELDSESPLAKRDLEQQIKVLEELAPISGAVANHWCEKEQAGYMWCHSLITNKLEELRKQVQEQGE